VQHFTFHWYHPIVAEESARDTDAEKEKNGFEFEFEFGNTPLLLQCQR